MTDPGGQVAGPIVGRMTHIDPKGIGAGLDEVGDQLIGISGWSEGSEDTGTAHRAKGGVLRAGKQGEWAEWAITDGPHNDRRFRIWPSSRKGPRPA